LVGIGCALGVRGRPAPRTLSTVCSTPEREVAICRPPGQRWGPGCGPTGGRSAADPPALILRPAVCRVRSPGAEPLRVRRALADRPRPGGAGAGQGTWPGRAGILAGSGPAPPLAACVDQRPPAPFPVGRPAIWGPGTFRAAAHQSGVATAEVAGTSSGADPRALPRDPPRVEPRWHVHWNGALPATGRAGPGQKSSMFSLSVSCRGSRPE